MNELWKKIHTEDGREVLFALYRVKNINEAYEKTGHVIRIAQENNVIDGLHVSLSQEDLLVTLQGASKDHISQSDWEIAGQIEQSLEA